MASGVSEMEKKHILIAGGGALILIAVAILSFGGSDDGQDGKSALAAATPASPALASLSAADIEVAPPGLDDPRPTDCLIEPSQVVRVNSGVEGVIQAVYVNRGDIVQRGQVVAQLRTDVERAGSAAAQARANNDHAIRAAESRAGYLASVRERSERISEYLAKDAVEEAQANARTAAEERKAAAQDQRVARLEYAQTQRIIGEKTVRSPVAGIVTERAMSPGEYRGPDVSHIVTVAQVHPLFVEVFAPIGQLEKIKLGDELAIIPEAPVGGRYMARVTVIDRVFDAASGTFGLRLELPNPEYKLPAGLRCRIEFSPAPAKPKLTS